VTADHEMTCGNTDFDLGTYRVLGRLGEGGMGAVFLGESPAGVRVAIKVIHPELASNRDSGPDAAVR
jgi:serine/threonine protein kinase